MGGHVVVTVGVFFDAGAVLGGVGDQDVGQDFFEAEDLAGGDFDVAGLTFGAA